MSEMENKNYIKSSSCEARYFQQSGKGVKFSYYYFTVMLPQNGSSVPPLLSTANRGKRGKEKHRPQVTEAI